MENMTRMTPEYMEKLMEKMKKEAQEAISRMTPEERERMAEQAKEYLASVGKNDAELFSAIDRAAKEPVKPAGKVCPHCGAPAEGLTRCEYCDQPL